MRILLVDDDPDDRSLFCEALARIDPAIHCKTAVNGEDAILTLESATSMPDIIFVDVNMPRMNGREFLAHIRSTKIYAHIPVVMYSTSADQNEIDNFCRQNVGYIIKPSSFTLLVEKLEKSLKYIKQRGSLASLIV